MTTTADLNRARRLLHTHLGIREVPIELLVPIARLMVQDQNRPPSRNQSPLPLAYQYATL